jgi:very-short-patch-repair endonuclease
VSPPGVEESEPQVGRRGGDAEEARTPADRKVAAIAARQHAMVHLDQLRAAGLGRGAIAHRVATGRLTRMHRAVYLVGVVVPPLGVEMAAVLAGGPGAVLSHLSAAAVWGIHGEIGGEPHITVAGANPPRIEGVTGHRVRRLDPADITVRANLPITTPARTIVDAAGEVGVRALARMLEEAEVLRLARPEDVRAALARAPRRRGAGALADLVERDAAPALTRSEAEAALLDLLRAAGIPPTAVNARVGPYEVDFLWRPQRLIAEVDGYAFHAGRAAFERDRLRDAELAAAGWRVLRVTWRQIAETPEAVVARIAAALAREPPG